MSEPLPQKPVTCQPPGDAPIIDQRRIPLFIRVRDFVLTIIAWAVLLYFIHRPIHYAYEYFFVYPHFGFRKEFTPNLPALWLRIQNYVYFAGCVIAWLLIWAIVRRRELRRIKDIAQPEPLPLEELAKSRGLEPARLAELQKEKLLEVNFGENHTIREIVPKPVTPVLAPPEPIPAPSQPPGSPP